MCVSVTRISRNRKNEHFVWLVSLTFAKKDFYILLITSAVKSTDYYAVFS